MKMKHLKKILIAASVVCCLAFAVPALADEAPAPEETEQETAGEDEEKEVETADQQESGGQDLNEQDPDGQDPEGQDPQPGTLGGRPLSAGISAAGQGGDIFPEAVLR